MSSILRLHRSIQNLAEILIKTTGSSKNVSSLQIFRNLFLYLVGGWTNPFEKYARQIGSFPQLKVKNKKYVETTN